jgi:ferric enterobactin receptor
MRKKEILRLVLIVLLLIVQLTSNAQNNNENTGGKIIGKVIDSLSKQPVEYATIILSAVGSNQVLNGTTADSTGSFKLPGIAPGAYIVAVDFIGFKTHTIKNLVINKKGDILNLKTILLSKSDGTLQGVVVTSQQKLIDNRIDKLVFNAEKDLTSQSGVATDVLKKVPQVSVDPDGNVELAGSGGIRFLINGKPSSAFGSNVTDVLQSIPASQIKSIEVITNPGAKYDAQGLGGIINIILKQSRVKGVNGNLSLTAGTRMENGSFNFTMRHGNFGLNAFVSGNARLTSTTPSISDRRSVDTIAKENVLLHQEGSSRFNRYGAESGLGFDWTVKKRNNFSGNINYNRFGNSGSGIINQQQQTMPSGSGDVISDIASANNLNNHFLFHNLDASLNYKRTFAKEDQELEVGVNTSLGNNDTRSGSSLVLMPQDSLYYGTNNYNSGKENETQINLDYTQPFKKNIMLGVGGKVTFNNITSNSDVYALQPITKEYLHDSLISNYLSYHQKVYALYAELSLPMGHLFDAKIGSRYERTEIDAYYSDAQEQVKNPGYNTLVPSIYFSRRITQDQTIKLSYSKRIERPDYGDLNPFVNTADPKNITAGNPYLLPEIGNRYELSYNHDFGSTGSFMITAFYRENNHDIQPYVTFYPSLLIGDSLYKNVSVTTRENIGLEKNTGVNLYGDLHPTEKLSIRGNLFFFHRYIINGMDLGRNPASFNYRTNLNVSYQFSNTLSGEFFGSFNSARNELQGKYPSFTTYTIAARKQFWNKKGSLALTATNLFNEYVRQATVLYGPNFITNSIRKIPFRSIGINFTWKFGKLDFKKNKEEDKGEAPAPEG